MSCVSLKKLVTKSKYSSKAMQELSIRLNGVNTGLVGFNGEKIVYTITDDMAESINVIKENINNVTVSDVKEVIMLDSLNSAVIEGARTTVDLVRKSFKSNTGTKNELMVINSVKATYFAMNQNGINSDNIRTIWETLVKDVCENASKAGTKYRSGKVVIASDSKIVHTPCDSKDVDKYMTELFKYAENIDIVKSIIIHFYFVYVHPFCDGNGRLARLWNKISLCKVNSNFKYIDISLSIKNSISEYYRTLTDSEYTLNGMMDITPFIEYMLDCLTESVCKAVTNKLNLSDVDRYILNKINIDGMTTSKLFCDKYSKDKIYKSLSKLTDNKILFRVKEGNRYRYFKYNR